MKFKGYRRHDGRVGTRNKVLILPSVSCSAEASRLISQQVPGTITITNQYGCGQIGEDVNQTVRTLSGFAANPNIYGTIVVSLGCEVVQPDILTNKIQEMTNKPLELIVIQEGGGIVNSIAKGASSAQKMVQEMSLLEREDVDVSELVVALECGGSDPTSGIAANPSVGLASDLIVAAGGTSIISETTEFIGAEHIFARRAANTKVRDNLLKVVQQAEKRRHTYDPGGRNISPGNIKGGLSTIEEKSLGCLHKGGTAPLVEVLNYAQRPSEKGLVMMDTPGYDVESVTGMVAGGAQICVFTTGRGTPVGNPLVPVIKVTGNPDTFRKLNDIIDYNAGAILDGKISITRASEEIFQEILAVASGKITKAESLGFSEIGISRMFGSV